METAFILLAILVIIVAIALTVFNLSTNKNLTTKIEINASKEDVWKVLMDFTSFTDWNPFIKNITGTPTKGNYISVTIQSSEKDSMNFQPRILVNETNKEFRWKGKLGITGIFDGEHYFKLESENPNKTTFIHGENFSGIISGALLKMIGKNTEKGFISMNNALKTRVENR